MLLVAIEKFGTNLMLVNVNKLKPYTYMKTKVLKKEWVDDNLLGIKCRWSLGGEF
jgi:hypothetical protein